MADLDEVSLAIGRIEGTVGAMDKKLDAQDAKMNGISSALLLLPCVEHTGDINILKVWRKDCKEGINDKIKENRAHSWGVKQGLVIGVSMLVISTLVSFLVEFLIG